MKIPQYFYGVFFFFARCIKYNEIMEIDMDKTHWDNNGCPKYDCRKAACKCGLKYVNLPAALGDDSRGSSVAPQNGAYCNAVVEYMANGHIYLYSSEGVPILVEEGIENLEKMVEKLGDDLAQETLDRQAADDVLQQEIDDIKNSPDVVDIVPTYAALQAYDTSKLGDNDIIRVLADETHDGQSTYYRWNATTSTWTYVGAVGDYYTKSQVDAVIQNLNSEIYDIGRIDSLFEAGGINGNSGNNASNSTRLRTPKLDESIKGIEVTPGYQFTLYAYDGNTYVGVWTGNGFGKTTHNVAWIDGGGFFDDYGDYDYRVVVRRSDNADISVSEASNVTFYRTKIKDFVGATQSVNGEHGFVPAPTTSDVDNFLKGDGTWADASTPVDSAFSDTSVNPVQNKVITEAIDGVDSQLYSSFSDTGLFDAGTIKGNTGENSDSTTRIRTASKLEASIMSIEPASGYQFALYAYDGDTYVGVWTGSSFVKTTSNLVWFTEKIDLSDYGNHSFRIIVAKTSGDTIAVSDGTNITFVRSRVTSSEDILKRTATPIRIMQNNVGKFNMGDSLDGNRQWLTTANYEDVIDSYRELYGQTRPDIIGMEEFQYEREVRDASDTSVVAKTISTDELIYDRPYPYKHTHTTLVSKPCLKSKYPILDKKFEVISYTYQGVSDSFRVLYAHLDVNGKRVAVGISAMVSGVGADQMAKRRIVFPMALDLFANDEYAFLIVDANNGGVGHTGTGYEPTDITPCIIEGDELYEDIIKPMGFESSMGSYYKWQETYRSPQTGFCGSVDNIYYKNNGKTILNGFSVMSGWRDHLLSDHVPVYADFLLK